MNRYDHLSIEQKWQKQWSDAHAFTTSDDSDKPKYYVLDMFPYPSGAGLHVGHPKGYIATDVVSRSKCMQGFNVLHPMGWDAFGLPAENYALKNKVHPSVAVNENVNRFKEQLSIIGFDYDWSREVNTTDSDYYKWTQWAFIQMFNKGLAFESHEPINWCPSCKTGLANEDLEQGKCERCGSEIEQRPMRQWVLKITDYADRLLEGLDDLDWEDSMKDMQRNWIGRSEGAEIEFSIKNSESRIKVFTTRPDTIFGATYMVLAPEHELVKKLESSIENYDEVTACQDIARKKTELERTDLAKDKTGVELKGIKAINPANGEEIPVWIADYVLAGYGTGAIMAVPAHDERDFEFATKYNLSIIEVISGGDIATAAHTGDGVIINSDFLNGLSVDGAKEKMYVWLEENNCGKKAVTYRLKDWVFSRQRYWGEPIPIIHCEKCGSVAVPESELPVELPDVEHYEPTDTGESPLANITDWVNTTCPKCGGEGKRETNTMPQWAGSCWYYLRYIDPKNNTELVSKDKEQYWSPVDLYVGGAEHATRHLIYARFWHKFLYDIGVVNYKEPFTKLQHVGLIMAEDGRKMSKRWGNVINPDDIVNNYGADSLRVYEMFMGPFDQAVSWSTSSIIGVRKFLEKVWKLQDKVQKDHSDGDVVLRETHKAIKKVTHDIEKLRFNTAISQMMILVNVLTKEDAISQEVFESLLLILSPFAPHITEELWHTIGYADSIMQSSWPEYNEALAQDDEIELVIQVNGKVRDKIMVPADISEDDAKAQSLASEKVQPYLDGREPKKMIFIKGRLMNIVV